jgi:hypothetical protein
MENKADFQSGGKKREIVLWSLFWIIVVIVFCAVGLFVYSLQESRIHGLETSYQQRIASLESQILALNPVESDVSDGEAVVEEPIETSELSLEKIMVDWREGLVQVKEGCSETNRCFLAGEVLNKGSIYEGKDFYLEIYIEDGPGLPIVRHYVLEVKDDGTKTKLYVNANEEAEGGKKAIIVGIDDLPEEINFPGTNYRLRKDGSPSYLFSEIKAGRKIFTDSKVGDFYLTEDGCLVVELPDHTSIAYNFILSLTQGESRVLDVSFGATKNQEEYDYIVPQCGGLCVRTREVSAEILKPAERLEAVGSFSNGEKVYRIKNSDDQYLKDLYNDKSTVAYFNDGWQQEQKNRYTYQEFINANPYLYWQDPLGRWIEFKNSRFSPAAEMCKPVLYLYPQKETAVDLKISLRGGLTHTEPLYRDGWSVSAMPDGTIKNLEDGKYYDSLLWEGVGINYPKPEQGWVVKRENLNSFLSGKLALLGLNEKESSDFKGYWLERLDEKPFYKISFLSRKQFDDLASIEFSPLQPKVFIRVMMTAEGMDRYVKIPEQSLPTNAPVRSGFTAVEWGGALLK